MSGYLDNVFGLAGKVAVVIGGTGELGGAMAQGLAGAGARVIIAGRHAQKGATRVAALTASGGDAWFAAVEATERASLEALRAAVLSRWSRIDIVINAAGANAATPFFSIDEAEFDRLIAVNLKSVFLGCQVFGEMLVERGAGGSIINLGSLAGLTPLSRVFTYAAAKAAVHNLSLNLAREWAPQRVRVNVLVPGFFPAEQNRAVLTPDRVAAILGATPMGRFGRASELIGATLLLASDAAGAFITGTELVVDGGFRAAKL